MILPEFLAQSDGYIHLVGHRVGLQDIVHYYNEGCSAEELCEVFPTLSLALIHKTLAFYLENIDEVHRYLAMNVAESEAQRAAMPRGPDRAELRRRLAVKQAAGV